jgi:hypothetical protein
MYTYKFHQFPSATSKVRLSAMFLHLLEQEAALGIHKPGQYGPWAAVSESLSWLN